MEVAPRRRAVTAQSSGDGHSKIPGCWEMMGLGYPATGNLYQN
jgi:hypothetical protein